MSYVLTLVASDHHKHPIKPEHITAVQAFIEKENIFLSCAPIWLSEDEAVDLGIAEKPTKKMIEKLRGFFEKDAIDVFIVEIEQRRKKILFADMDSTIVDSETLDELAGHAGIKDKIAEITALAMQGELDFETALRQRVILLRGMPSTMLNDTLEEMKLNPGARCLVQTMKKFGAPCVLLSGGFSFFTRAVARDLGFDVNHGNILEIKDHKITGTVLEPILGKYAKQEFMDKYLEQHKLHQRQSFAIGDGANDIPMLKRAGLGIGYHAKPIVDEKIDNNIVHGDLTASLFAQGIMRSDFVEQR